jgi:hypothetical protein
MGAGNYGGQGGGMPAYQQMSSYPQGPSGKGGSSSYGPPPQRMAPPSPFGSGKGGGRAGMQDSYSRMMPPPFMQAQQAARWLRDPWSSRKQFKRQKTRLLVMQTTKP